MFISVTEKSNYLLSPRRFQKENTNLDGRLHITKAIGLEKKLEV